MKSRMGYLKYILILLCALFVSTYVFEDVLRVKSADAVVGSLPAPMSVLCLSEDFDLPVLKGVVVDDSDIFNLTFIVDGGDREDFSKNETSKLINYFLAGLAFSKEDIWVNLSPYEKNRIIDTGLSQTELGIDLVAQDYILKQLSSSLTHPDTPLGKAYWGVENRKLKIENRNKLENRNGPYKIWISPDYAEVSEDNNVALITKSRLKVKSKDSVINEMICPAIERDVNRGKNFASLRQIYSSLILSQWFKRKFIETYYKNYINSEKVAGIDTADPRQKEKIYQMYLESFEKGSYNIVENKNDEKREYFSGGWEMDGFDVKVKQTTSRHILKKEILGSSSINFVQTSLRSWRGDEFENVSKSFQKIDNLITKRSSSGLVAAFASDMLLLKKMINYRKSISRWLDEEGIYQSRFKKFLGPSWNTVEEMISGTEVTKLMYIQIDALSCNSFCVWCSASGAGRVEQGNESRKKILDKKALLKLLDDVNEQGYKPLIRYAGWVGEPLADEATVDLIKRAGEYGFKQILITNGRHLNKELWPLLAKYMDYVSVSMDAPSEEINQSLKKGESQGVWTNKMNNIEGLIDYAGKQNSDMQVKVSYILHPENFNHLEDFVFKLQKLGVSEFIPKVAHNEPNAKLTSDELKIVFRNIKILQKKFSAIKFKVSPLQDYEEAEGKMTQYDLPDFKLCYTSRWQHVVGGEKFFSCCHYNLGTIGAYGNVGSDNFGDIWRSKERIGNLNNDPKKTCKSCPPTDLHLNRTLNGIAQAYGFDEMILDYIKSKIDGRTSVAKSLSPFKMIVGRIDPYTGGILLKLLFALKIYNMRDVIRALHFQQRNIGVVDVEKILKADIRQSAREYDILYNPLKDHSVKQDGNPPYMYVPDNFRDLIYKFGLKSLYLIPSFISWKLKSKKESVFDNLPYTTRYFKWKKWKILPDMYSWAMEDTCTIMSAEHEGQDNITESDINDMNELIKEIGYGSITYGSLGAGSKIDHKNFRFAGIVPKKNILKDKRILKYESNHNYDLSQIVNKVNDKLKEKKLKSNILFTVADKANQVLITGRTKESSKVLEQPHGAWEVLLNKIVLTKKNAFKKVDQRLVSPAQAKGEIDHALNEVMVSQELMQELGQSLEKSEEAKLGQNGGIEFQNFNISNKIESSSIDTSILKNKDSNKVRGLTFDVISEFGWEKMEEIYNLKK